MKSLRIANCRWLSGTFALFVIATCGGESIGNQQSEISNLFVEASRAIDEKVPEVAIEKLQTMLSQNPSPDERARATRKLARALLDANRAEDALKLLENPASDEERMLKAETFAALGCWSDAAAIFRELSATENPFVKSATLGLAESLRMLGKHSEAAHLLEIFDQKNPSTVVKLRLAELFLDANLQKRANAELSSVQPANAFETKWKKCLAARALLAQDQPAPALISLEEILRDPRDMTERLFASATIALTNARIILNGLQSADDVIEDFIWHHPQSAYLEEMFARLDDIYAGEENPSESELQKWSGQQPRRRAALAQFYLAKAQLRDERNEKAYRTFTAFLRENPTHPFAAKAYEIEGNALLAENKFAAAVSAFEGAMRATSDADTMARLEISAGSAEFKRREFLLAANWFDDAAQCSLKFWQEASHNSALAWLNLGNYAKFLDEYKAISARFPESDFRRDLLLEEGLLQARSHDVRAMQTLQLFIRDFPDHSRAPEARIALAELAFLSSDIDSASVLLKAANENGAQNSERGDYLAIFVADAQTPRDDAQVIALCENFLRAHAGSALQPDVRMKLGQVYFRREDFANAQTQFETLATESNGTPFAETALFLAGQSAMRSMNSSGIDRALELFEQVAKLNGPLKLYARQEQAIAKMRLGKEAEAIILYDTILHATPENALRFSALCGKADALVAPGNADACSKAVAIYDELATDPDVTRTWRNQALFKKAKCLEKSGDAAKALTTFYDVLQPQVSGEPEFFWYYKAGFDAARLLEAQEKWESAIGIYDKLAKAQGPRSEEAGTRENQLRLEHFIWE